MIVKTIVEQRKQDEYRNRYNCVTKYFDKTEYKSLLYERGFTGVYGWIIGYGHPPEKHLDILVITNKEYELGKIITIKIIGVFIRNDNDNKFVGIERNRPENDFNELKIDEKNMIMNIYPNVRKGEGWFGKDKAIEIIKNTKINI